MSDWNDAIEAAALECEKILQVGAELCAKRVRSLKRPAEFICLRCEMNLSVPSPTNECPICGWKRPAEMEGGYVLVPVKATKAMEDAHFACHANAKTVFAGFDELWSAILAARPTPSHSEGDER